MAVSILQLKSINDSRGGLVYLEHPGQCPFEIKRVYYLFGMDPQVARGFHAHKELRQLIMAVAGSFELILDDGVTRHTTVLDSPTKACLIEPGYWREMHNCSRDCVILVLASERYSEDDYIRDYEKFLIFARNNGQ